MKATMLAIALIVAIPASRANTLDSLETPSYTITVESRCPEGWVTCDDVKYVGTSKKTGKSITLTGKTVHTMGADGVTPAHFLGYVFKNGRTTYFVSEDGQFRVTRSSKVLVDETGVWKR
jgi:hypothetical protein